MTWHEAKCERCKKKFYTLLRCRRVCMACSDHYLRTDGTPLGAGEDEVTFPRHRRRRDEVAAKFRDLMSED